MFRPRPVKTSGVAAGSEDQFMDNFMNGALPPNYTLTRASTGWHYDASGLITSKLIDVARFTYNPITLEYDGLLNEPARTNLIFPSTPTAASWTNGATYAVDNQAISPDGTLNATKYKAANAANPQLYKATASIADATTYSWSAFLRRDLTSALPLDIIFVNQAIVTVSSVRWNLAGVGASVVSTGTAPIRDVKLHASGYYYCHCSSLSTAAGTGYHQLNMCDPGSNVIAAPDANSGVFVYGAQLEAASNGLPSSPIITVGAAVTRATDILTRTLTNGTYTVSIVRASGTTILTGQVVGAGTFVIPTDLSPVRYVSFKRTA